MPSCSPRGTHNTEAAVLPVPHFLTHTEQLFCAENSANLAPKNRPLALETKEFLHGLSVLYLTPTTSPHQME